MTVKELIGLGDHDTRISVVETIRNEEYEKAFKSPQYVERYTGHIGEIGKGATLLNEEVMRWELGAYYDPANGSVDLQLVIHIGGRHG